MLSLQAAAGMGIYGPRTVFCIALKDAPGCHEFLLQDDGKWLHVKETTEIGEWAGGGLGGGRASGRPVGSPAENGGVGGNTGFVSEMAKRIHAMPQSAAQHKSALENPPDCRQLPCTPLLHPHATAPTPLSQ